MPHEFHTQRRVEFSDTDLAGVVHFARHPVYVETAEHEFLRSLGASVSMKVDGQEIGWPRLAFAIEYLSPARFEDVLDIHLIVVRKGTKSWTYRFTISKGDVLVARGQVTAACCLCHSTNGFTAIPIPSFIADKLEVLPQSD